MHATDDDDEEDLVDADMSDQELDLAGSGDDYWWAPFHELLLKSFKLF